MAQDKSVARLASGAFLVGEIRDERLGFVDTDNAMLGWDEKPRKELYVTDGLHLTPAGYQILNALVRPFLVPAPAPAPTAVSSASR